MVRKKGHLLKTERADLYGGQGAVMFEHIMEAEKGEFYEKGRLFSVAAVPPGGSIGYHVHEGEMECYYILSGSGKYNDNNKATVTVSEGDATITLDGEGHSIENDTNEDLVFIALIIYA